VFDATLHTQVVWALFALAGLTFVLLFFISAPYGRHARAGWGPSMPSRLVWVVMESPSVLVFFVVFAFGAHRGEVVPLVLLVLWQLHYVHRTYVFPFRIRAKGKRTPVVVGFMALAFTSVNAWVNAAWIGHLGTYELGWLVDPRFLGGVALFLVGWVINLHADTVLIRLRAPGETGYRIPQGGLYRYVSCPNYLGEILEWIGWALATWSLAGAAFAVYTIANLAPRARTHHRWYQDTFPDYPPERRALLPFIA